ncbi:DUF2207 domain-containing protein [Blastopirellula sp. JC732]|uniref:DUF2207 domain-containing protein n=1 Tax=Blastopirellula sediminis TaxID=2894196 RepID=A0A9X1MN66_9BACT|nr:DUF2207 domain-containing protein [Blastopirellula sediminis]MCC9606454.1 DUF2207 domain-containing protein [Blastopirellula sediminis]MCC9630248.1 DUF2207 domain-containing protein [Blastopirellula sediminis]
MQGWKPIQAMLLAIIFVSNPLCLCAAEDGDKPLPTVEAIRRYDVDIKVQADSKLHVVETIEVTSLGQEIRRGIYRDFPVITSPTFGIRKKHSLDVISATRDGKPENFRVEQPDENRPYDARIYLGEAQKVLDKGTYVYTIEYVTDGWLHHDETFDELYWNVTGNFWNFPIQHSSVTIHLPDDFKNDQLTVAAWTGASGEMNQDWRQLDAPQAEIKLETTSPLLKKEGWTVSVKFPTGAVTFPSESEAYGQLLNDNADLALTLLTLVCAFGVYVIGWFLVGRDPAPGAILVQDSPPEGLSPAAARYVSRMGFDNTCLAAALVYAESQGAIKLGRNALGDYTATKSKGADFSRFSPDVYALLRGLFANSKQITFSKLNHMRISSAISEFKTTLINEHRNTHFVVNYWWTLWGVSISVVGILMAILSTPNYAVALFLTFWLSMWSVGVYFLSANALGIWKAAFYSLGFSLERVLALIGALFMTAFALPFIIAEVVVLGVFAYQVSFFILIGILLLVIMGRQFFHLMKRPTHEGRQLLDHLDGYRQWLEGEFVRQVQYASSPEEGALLLDERLPWAMAFGLSDGWYKQLGEKVLEASQFQDNTNNYPSRSIYGPAGRMFTGAALAGALGSAVYSSSISPSKGGSGGSGGSGGGSSGGGGGGGGGGGW